VCPDQWGAPLFDIGCWNSRALGELGEAFCMLKHAYHTGKELFEEMTDEEE
jgi:hypothetical protein